MNQIIRSPYRAIWLCIPVLLFISIIRYKSAFDIQLHDTYFVIATIHIGLFFSVFLGLTGFLYWLVRKKNLVSWMTVVHVLSTFVMVLFISYILLLRTGPKAYISFDIISEQIVVLILLGWSICQIVFVINLLGGSIRKDDQI